ncbi:MAG: flagellar hook capping FlgD N-terminal domain-containing protein [Bryobacteraceae bacterium]|jgi:flagellar basal-body rod modification protein FlgD
MSSIPSPITPTIPAPDPTSLTATQTANLASENTFLQLLVAQLQNQDPEQPTDGTAFVTELAQFTTLSEDTESATDLDTIVAALPSLEPVASVAAAGSSGAATASNATAASNGTTKISNQ